MKGLLWLCLLLLFPLKAATLVVHSSVPLETLSQSQLRNIFTLRQTQWPDGTPVKVIVLADSSPLHQRFCREQLRLFPYQLTAIWDKRSFSGTGRRPQQVDSMAAMLELVRTEAGAIGYVEAQYVGSAVKEVRIE
jgi:ABC-type phosphate transport system substrate-binding protein